MAERHIKSIFELKKIIIEQSSVSKATDTTKLSLKKSVINISFFVEIRPHAMY